MMHKVLQEKHSLDSTIRYERAKSILTQTLPTQNDSKVTVLFITCKSPPIWTRSYFCSIVDYCLLCLASFESWEPVGKAATPCLASLRCRMPVAPRRVPCSNSKSKSDSKSIYSPASCAKSVKEVKEKRKTDEDGKEQAVVLGGRVCICCR